VITLGTRIRLKLVRIKNGTVYQTYQNKTYQNRRIQIGRIKMGRIVMGDWGTVKQLAAAGQKEKAHNP
jgi:hypothetical protein